MKAAEILRKLADLIDQNSGNEQEVPHAVQTTELTPIEVDNTDHADNEVMVAPLQQKLELLKKATGVESHYDDEGCESDELTQIKRNAGISPVVLQTAGEDGDTI